jgi:nucleotide-binding universal stress UspA family protein
LNPVKDEKEEGSMFAQVIAGVDGKPGGRDAALLASKLVAPDGQLTLVHVHAAENNFRGVNYANGVRHDSLDLSAKERSATEVDAQVAAVGARSVGAGLHSFAEEHDADLLVVGSSSHGPVGRLLLGDHMRASLEGAPCAVAVAPHGYAEHPRPFATVGVAYDGSPESEAALALAREIAGEHRSKITALTATSMPTYSYGAMVAIDWNGVMEDLEREARARLDALGDVQGRVVREVATEALAEFGAEVDLLVVGSRGYGPARRMLFGSTSEYLARHAPCPLLVLSRGVEAHLEAHREPSQTPAGASTARV